MAAWRWSLLVALGIGLAIAAPACGSSSDSEFPDLTGGDGGPLGGGDGSFVDGTNGGGLLPDGGLDPKAVFVVAPADKVIDVTVGQPIPTVGYTATVNGKQVDVGWSVDRGEIGTIDAAGGVFTPSQKLGGTASVIATYHGGQASAKVTVHLHVVQNGATASDAGTGVGGSGGVGGEGSGGAVDNGTVTALNGTPKADPGLAWLYPYDQTVWPRGILAPLLQWKPGAAAAYDAVLIQINEASFDYKGYFKKTAASFIHHPIPQDVWKQLAYSNAGEAVTVSLTFAAGGAAYGPITETWKVASGSLKGVVYYNSYGTKLAKNSTGALGGDGKFGGATLAIHGASTDPVLVAGASGDDTKCRVCHSVSADGSTLITEHGESYGTTSRYDLKQTTGNETAMTPTDGRFAWGAPSPDGTAVFSNAAPLPGAKTGSDSALYAVPAGTPITTTGFPAGLQAGTPAFSPDGNHIAFNFYAGTVGAATGDKKSLGFLDFAKPGAFSNFASYAPPASGTVLYPSFLPTNDGVVFQLETVYSGRGFGETRSTCDDPTKACSSTGPHGELWWFDVKTKASTRLDRLNGKGYLPVGANAHDADATLNYEPTVNPVPSGGYAWVVFTSRRMYGNVATINPFWSDPRNFDISATPTPKKLWVAAVDLNGTPGTDPSHPAFYLPAQELLAGNSRGYWVVDPCKTDGTSCETGDECCGGFCRPNGDGGFACVPPPTGQCSQEFEKCTTAGDCCDTGSLCVNGRCAKPPPN